MSDPNLPSRIYLIGMMGVGKTTLGRQLAKLLNYTFLDLDRDIEEYENLTIQQIFEQRGEAYFRKAEHEALQRTASHSRIIIATGGGTPCFFENMKWINEHGKSIYLRANSAFILSRIGPNRGKRPLLRGLNDEELREFIEKTLALREPYYGEATHVANLPVKSLPEAVKSMLMANPDGGILEA
jgi:shikimate kinase